jgi:hypothetical protein
MRDHISKITKAKRAEGVAQVVQCLPSKCKALSSNPDCQKEKKKKEDWYYLILRFIIEL